MKIIIKTLFILLICFFAFDFSSCKKDKIITDSNAKIQFSQDSVLFDTVFTTIGSSTKNIRVRNKNTQPIKISSIYLKGGSASPFILNVDGLKGINFDEIEIAAKDSLYIFIQVNVNPNSGTSPIIINDEIVFSVNGNIQKLYLEAWGQNAYYHYPTDAIKFKDGSYLPYSRISQNDNDVVTWITDKPHVIYGYLVVDSTQKLIINAGVRVYLNNKAGLWVYKYGELKVNGLKGNEVIFTGARRDKEYLDEPGQWDRIWINEGSLGNEINYAIIKNGYIGVQAELLGNDFNAPKRLKITNTKIQNMSLWGLFGSAFNIYGGNNVVSNCQEHSVNLTLGGKYTFIHCTFANFWEKEKTREKSTLNINNYSDVQVLPLDSAYFGNCIVDGILGNEISLDLDISNTSLLPNYIFSNCWLKTTNNVSDPNKYIGDIRTGANSLAFNDYKNYIFQATTDSRIRNFTHTKAQSDALKYLSDINTDPRNTFTVTVGAYEN